MEGLYRDPESCDWKKIHYLALTNRDAEIRPMVVNAQQLSVRMPVIRKVIKSGSFLADDGKTVLFSVEESKTKTIVCDVVSNQSLQNPFHHFH